MFYPDYSKNIIYNIYNQSLTPEFCFYMLQMNPNFLVLIPDIIKTYDMCFYAVLLNPESIRMVPSKFMNQNICQLAYSKNPQLYDELKVYL